MEQIAFIMSGLEDVPFQEDLDVTSLGQGRFFDLKNYVNVLYDLGHFLNQLKDHLLTKCLVCEEIGFDNEIQSWSPAFGIDTLPSHYIEHAKWKLFKDKHMHRLQFDSPHHRK